MSDLILYNYPLSPFSEKIRLMLGYAGLAWRSVRVTEMPPRPVLDVLVGGYRKIPVAQIGADVYCDTKTITTQIARLSGKPALALENCADDIQAFVRRADAEVFMAFVMTAGPGALVAFVKETSLLATLRFVKDRIGIFRKAKMKAMSGADAKALTRRHLDEMETLLKQGFLFGEQPCVADFSAFHSIHTILQLKGARLFVDHAKVAAWFKRMQAFGHGSSAALSDEQALDIARDAQPADLGEHAISAPRVVSIAPDDYARDPVKGLLIGEHEHGWVLRREHPRIGSVNLHFPKAGFSLRDA